MNTTGGDWGPSHQREPRRTGKYGPVGLIAIGVAMWLITRWLGGSTAATLVAAGVVVAVVWGIEAAVKASRSTRARPAIPSDPDPLRAMRSLCARAGGGVPLGTTKDGTWRFTRPERATLLVGPPRSGKTSGVIIPAVLTHSGPVVVTSTKQDVARATAAVRSRDGGRGCSTRRAPPVCRG